MRTFRDALQAEFPEYAIVLERGIQRCYKFLLDTNARTGKLQKDIGEDRILIDDLAKEVGAISTRLQKIEEWLKEPVDITDLILRKDLT